MKLPGVLLVLLVLVGVPALAAAEYGAGSAVEADAPVGLGGRVDGVVAKGVASYLSERVDDNLLLSLTAAEVDLRFVTVPPACPSTPGAVPCPPLAQRAPQEERHVLKGATVKVLRPLGAFTVIAANDPDARAAPASIGTPGPLLVTGNAAGTQLTSTAEDEHLSPYQRAWETKGPAAAATQDVYTADARQGRLVAPSGGSLRGGGGLALLLQGVAVEVKGTEDGKPFSATYEMPVPASASEPTKFLSIETPSGLLNAASRAPLLAHGVALVEATGAATLKAATGQVVRDGETTTYDREDATLPGPVALTLSEVKAGPPLRLVFSSVSSQLRISQGLPPLPEEDEERDTAALVAAGAAGASSAGLLAAIAYFWPRLKFGATLLLLPLYSRIERTAVLEHEKRDEIYGLIRATPGIHAHEIGERANIGWGTTVYHLKLLENHNLVVSQKSGRYKRFFVNTGEFTKKKDVYGALRNETAKSVAQYIVEHPGVTQKDLCAALGIQPSLASWHVEKLEGVELVKRVKDGRQVRYFAGPAWSQLNVRIDARGGGEGVAET